MKTLHLNIKRLPFEVMVCGEKRIEYRLDTKWIKSRLYKKNGKPKMYDRIRFTLGYGADKPYFICEYKGTKFNVLKGEDDLVFRNGLTIPLYEDNGKGGVSRIRYHQILLGNIIEVGNYQFPLKTSYHAFRVITGLLDRYGVHTAINRVGSGGGREYNVMIGYEVEKVRRREVAKRRIIKELNKKIAA